MAERVRDVEPSPAQQVPQVAAPVAPVAQLGPAAVVLQLQATAGNQAVGRMLSADAAGPSAAQPGVAGAQQIIDAIAAASAQGRERLLSRAAEVSTQIQEAVQEHSGALGATAVEAEESARATFAGARGDLGARSTAHHARLDTDAERHQGQVTGWQTGAFNQAQTAISSARSEVAALQSSHVQQAESDAQENAQTTSAALEQSAQTAQAVGGTGEGGDEAAAKGRKEVADRVSGETADQITQGAPQISGRLRQHGVEAAQAFQEQGDKAVTAVTAHAEPARVMITEAGTEASRVLTSSHRRAQEGATQVVAAAEETLNTQETEAVQALRAARQSQLTQLAEAGGQAVTAVHEEVQSALSAADEQAAALTAQVASAQVDEATAAELIPQIQQELAQGFDDGADSLSTAAASIPDTLGTAAAQGGEGLRRLAPQLQTQTSAHLNQVGEALDRQGDSTAAHLQSVSERTRTGGNQALDDLSGALGTQVTGTGRAFDTAQRESRKQAGDQALQATQAAGKAADSTGERIAKGQAKVDEKAKEPKQERSWWQKAGDWLASQLADLWNRLKDPGFWVGLILTVGLMALATAFLGPFALIALPFVTALAAGAATATDNVVAGRPWSTGVLAAMGEGFVVGAVFAVAIAGALYLGAGALGVLLTVEAVTVVSTMVLNAIHGQPLTKGLLANMALAWLADRIFGARAPGEAEPTPTETAPPETTAPEPEPAETKAPENEPAETETEEDPQAEDRFVACFLAGTPVLLADTTLPIEDVRPGATVLARPGDPGTAPVPRQVSDAYGGTTRTATRITVGGAHVLATPRHRFRLRNGTWLPAHLLNPGDLLDTADGVPATIEAVAEEHYLTPVTTYNLTVPGASTYFVIIGARPVLVHNGPPPPKLPDFDRVLYWIFGNKPRVRPTDTDGLSMWKTTSKADVDKLMEARVNGDGRSLDDAHAFYDEAALTDAGVALPETPGHGTKVVDTGLSHHSARPAANADPEVPLTQEEITTLQGLMDSAAKTVVKPKALKGTCG